MLDANGCRENAQALRSHDLAATPVLAAWAPIESLDWIVFVEQPVAEVYAKLNASMNATMVSTSA